MCSNYVLGIDTSNYKSSVAVVDCQGHIICDLRRPLNVKQGERGLRQSNALFQHIENLPELLEDAFRQVGNRRIAAVAYSEKPRPQEGSYMPVFKAGIGFGRSVAAALCVPGFGFSHQEGHIEAVKRYSELSNDEELLCYHLSGGTCELLHVKENQIKIIGGSKDISFGQLIDRIGVSLNMLFPAGQEMDKIAIRTPYSNGLLKDIPLDKLYLNLSGLETQTLRLLSAHGSEEETANRIIAEVFKKIAEVLCHLTERAANQMNIKKILFTGGVASSVYISDYIVNRFRGSDLRTCFGNQALSQDNGVGIALLGAKKLTLHGGHGGFPSPLEP